MSGLITHNVISVNSKDRNKTAYPNTGDFVINLPFTIRDVSGMRLVSARIPNNWKSVYSGGNQISMTISGYSADTATIPDGAYDDASLLTSIKTALDAIATSQASGDTFTVEYDDAFSALKITSTTNDFTLNFSSADFTLDKKLFGFNEDHSSNETSSSNVLTSDLPVENTGGSMCYISIENLPQENGFTKDTTKHTFFILNSSSKQTIINSTQIESHQFVDFNSLENVYQLKVKLFDDEGRNISPMTNWTMAIEFFVKSI